MPLSTRTVIVVEPDCPATGVTVTVRFELLPPKTMFASGTKFVLEDVPDTTKDAAVTDASPTVKGIGPVELFVTMVTWLPKRWRMCW